jgi:anti-sigma regulatory factor (Ser/Thr protein kinase)
MVEVELAADAGAVRCARAVVDRVARGLPGDVGFRARVAVGELVANGVEHAAGAARDWVGLGVFRSATGIRVEVRDRGAPFDETPRVVSGRATSGRGLRIMDALVDRWGVEHESGNLVWFEIDEPADAVPDPPSTRPEEEAPESRRSRASPPLWTGEDVFAAAFLAHAAERVRVGWCRGTDARDESGAPVEPWSGQAAAWSLLGALVASLDGPEAVPDVSLPALASAMAALAELIEDRSLSGWNDAPGRTQQEVIAVLERARMLLPGLHVFVVPS